MERKYCRSMSVEASLVTKENAMVDPLAQSEEDRKRTEALERMIQEQERREREERERREREERQRNKGE